ncbi:MAG: hypothetical protein E6J09_05785 [Chloroflexi bacterium]|nr:MAG: hypothetical protein E6J09_05785 [Chloroflexota bacterium]
MRTRILAVTLVALTACTSLPTNGEALPSPTPVALVTAGAEPTAVATPSLVPPTAHPEPSPRVTREVAGFEFALVPGAADLRVDTSLSREDEAVVATTVASDLPAVEREFARSFAGRPVIYVFATTPGYTEGFVRIFGYGRATATFVAENSVSFFEPSLRLIAVNWEAVRDRRPIAAIRHELTHLLTLDACAPRCDLVPAWLNEGQARIAEALVPGSDWRLVRVRYEAASMAETGTLIPLNALVSQLAWNALSDWAGYFKYQEAARAVELLREDIGGDAPIALLYERLRRGQNVAQAYAYLTGRSFDDFVTGLAARMRGAVPQTPGLIAVAPASYLLYGFAPATTVVVTVSGPRGSESWPMVISPFGSNFDGVPPTRARGGYTISAQDASGVFTAKVRKMDQGSPGDLR